MSIHLFEPANRESPDTQQRVRDALADLSQEELLTLVLTIEKAMQRFPVHQPGTWHRTNSNAGMRL